MGYLKERVYYLKGLSEGLNVGSSDEGKLLNAIIEVLDDFAVSVEEIEQAHEELAEQVDNIDEDLASVEDIVFVDDDEEDEHELACPFCKEVFSIHVNDIDTERNTITCPHCKKDISVVWECDCGECSDEHNHEE
jgi:hypothetical protein